jgi:hypothetical protein
VRSDEVQTPASVREALRPLTDPMWRDGRDVDDTRVRLIAAAA